MPRAEELEVEKLGPCSIESPLRNGVRFMDDDHGVLPFSDTAQLRQFQESGGPLPAFEPAGPRSRLYFDPRELTCGIVTCGGLCPGINDVIRSIVTTLTCMYRVREILGFRYGYAGLRRRPSWLSPRARARIFLRIHPTLNTTRPATGGSKTSASSCAARSTAISPSEESR